MADGDLLRRFLFERWPVRGHFVRLESSWRAVTEHHDYPEPVTAALGEAVAASALLAGTIKFDGQLTLQFQGPGPVHLMVVQCSHRMALRGVARYRGTVGPGTIADLTGGGQLTVTLENTERTSRYQGVVPLDRPRLQECLEQYLARSEQIPSKLVLASSPERAAGILLQRMPSGVTASGEGDPHAREEAEDAWRRIELLAATLSPAELLTLSPETLLRRLFNEDDVRLFDGTPVYFQCACSRERVSGILKSLGVDEARDILRERDNVEVRCEFCNRAYVFDPVDVEALFKPAGTSAAPRAVH
jgi:molecular chaperone Hsp33